jgi:hypothetical protein
VTDDWNIVGFLCEATLTDQDKRTSLIGIMPGKLGLPAFPTALSLGAFVRISPLPPQGTPIKIEFHLGSHKLAEVEAASVETPAEAANVFGLDALHVNMGRIIMMLEEPTDIKLTVTVAGSKPVLAAALRVVLAASPSP